MSASGSSRSSQHDKSCTYFDVLHRLELDGDLIGELGESWQSHLSACSDCRARASDESAVLAAFTAVPALAESRHEEILATVLAAGPETASPSSNVGSRTPGRTPWPFANRRRIAAVLASASLTGALLGWGLGSRLGGGLGGSPSIVASDEVTQQAHRESRDLRRRLALAQLRDPSASRRLSAVLEIGDTPLVDDAVLSAVLWRLQYDPSVNVRLSAVRAVASELDRPEVTEQILASLDRPPDPLVRLAMVDAFAELDSRAGRDTLRALRDSPHVDPVVREHAADRLSRANDTPERGPSASARG